MSDRRTREKSLPQRLQEARHEPSRTVNRATTRTRYNDPRVAHHRTRLPNRENKRLITPFILRNVTLAGINSVNAPQNVRRQAGSRLAGDVDLGKLA